MPLRPVMTGAEYWALVERTAQVVNTWPKWKLGSPNNVRSSAAKETMNETRNDIHTPPTQAQIAAVVREIDMLPTQMLPEPQTHYLKCWPQYFDALERGDKRFEIRRDDRGFQRGDFVVLQRTRVDRPHVVETQYGGVARYTLRFRIGWILTGGQFGLEPGFVAMQLVEV